MNFLELQERLAVRRGARVPLNSETALRFKSSLNEVHRRLLRKPGREALRYGVVPFTSVADQKLYALPAQGVARINRITEATNDRRLAYQTPDWLDAVAPDPTTGTPWAWIPQGLTEVHTQPSDASSVYVVSTSGSDTGTCHVEGITEGGYYQRTSVTMTGVTAVNLAAAVNDFIQITKFYLSSSAVGTVTLHEDSGVGTELSRIAAGDVRAQFHLFQLYLTPAADITYFANVLRSVPDMRQDTDEPLLPEDFHDLLIDMAEQKELRKADDPNRWGMLSRDIAEAESELNTFLTAHPDWRPTFGGHEAQFSSLGAWFPADTRIG
jgi:hypothetical protein